MDIPESIIKAKEIGAWVHSKTNSISVPSDERTQIGSALLQHVLDIADGITALFESNLPGPAFTLFRSLHEAYVRAVWLLQHASDKDLLKFKEGKVQGFNDILKDIGKDSETGGAFISEMSELNRSDFHGLTHGGMEHVLRRVSSIAIEPSYPEEEIKMLIKARNQYATLSTCFLLQLANDEKSLLELIKKQDEWRSK